MVSTIRMTLVRMFVYAHRVEIIFGASPPLDVQYMKTITYPLDHDPLQCNVTIYRIRLTIDI